MDKARFEAIKEFARTTLLSVLATAMTSLLTGVNTQTGEIHINGALVVAGALTGLLTGLLRAIDKFGFESGSKVKMPF